MEEALFGEKNKAFVTMKGGSKLEYGHYKVNEIKKSKKIIKEEEDDVKGRKILSPLFLLK